MSYIKLLINDLKRLIKYNTLTFLVVSLSMMFVTFGLLFYAGYIAYGYVDEESEIYFNVYLDDDINEDEIIKLCDRLSNDDIIQMAVAESKSDYESDDKMKIIGEYNKSYEILKSVGKVNNLKDNLKDDGKGVVICEDYIEESFTDDKNIIGKEITIDGNKLPIRAVLSFKDYKTASMSIKKYINTFKTNYIRLGYNNKNIKKQIIKILQKERKIKKYDTEESKPIIFKISFWMKFSEILLMFCVIIINSFMIISYWIKQQQNVYNIYKICGASERTVRWLEICKMFCVLSVCSIFSLVLFFIMKEWMVSKELVADLRIFYVEICIIVLFILLLFTYIAVKREHKKSIIYYVKE